MEYGNGIHGQFRTKDGCQENVLRVRREEQPNPRKRPLFATIRLFLLEEILEILVRPGVGAAPSIHREHQFLDGGLV